MKKYDCIVLGSGPGGYIAAIRSSQLGNKTAIVEEDKLGGVCLNRGCIPTKAVLKAAHCVHEIKHFKSMGIHVELKKLSGADAVHRAAKIAKTISGGVAFLMKKNKIDVIQGRGRLKAADAIEVQTSGKTTKTIKAKSIVIATGAGYRSFPGLEHDGRTLIGAWEAIAMDRLPKSIGIVGAGAIGVEFAYFWNAFGVDVHIFELQKHLLPVEDEESSKELERAYKKYGIKMSLGIGSVKAKAGDKKADIEARIDGKKETFSFEKVLIAVGMTGHIHDIGLEALGLETEGGFIRTNAMGQTNIGGVYAIGDVAGPPLLAHAASHEGIIAAEHLSGITPHPLSKMNIPGCTYCQPQVASVGYTERALKERGIDYKVGKVPFSANGKAMASAETGGFIKTLVGRYGELLGAHIVGTHATELIHEYVLFRTMEGIDEDILATVHPHPTLGEFLAESVLAAKGRALNC